MRFPTAGLCFSAAAILLACSTTKPMTSLQALQKDPVAGLRNSPLLDSLLTSRPELFGDALKNRDAWRIQLIYTQIDRDAVNKPNLTHHYFNVQPDSYFYPASTVKMPVAALALQRLNELKIPGLTRETTMLTGKAAPHQAAVEADSTAANGKPSVGHYVKKIFLVSDNDAYNRLYEFLGQEYVNQELWKRGYVSVQLLHRLQISLTEEQNRQTNPVTFVNEAGKPIYDQPAASSSLTFSPRSTLLGTGYRSGGKLVQAPFHFSKKNRLTLPELHTMVQSLMLPETLHASQRFNLTEDDYRFLRTYMSMKPGESLHPAYDTSYTDAYVKFLLFGGKGPITSPSLRIFNKVGDAYGFLLDAAYVVDFEKGVEFLLSAVIYCNSDGIFNDDNYDYDTVGFPFMKNLGQTIYEFETKRPKKHLPDLSRYRMNYDH